MNMQRICPKGKNSRFVAIRCFNLDSPDAIKKDAPVFFSPELGGIIYNFERYDETRGRTWKLKQPVDVGEIRATLYVEIWGFVKGEKKRLLEKWYATGKPEGFKSLNQFIIAFLNQGEKQSLAIAKSKEEQKPKPFLKNERVTMVDPIQNATEATLRLLMKDYPALAKAIRTDPKNREARAKTFIVDTVRQCGSAPSGFSTDDPKFVAMIAEAWQAYERRTKHKSKADAIDWHLADPRTWARYYCMKPEAIAPLVSKATNTTQLSADAIAKRIERLGLIQPWKRGKPSKK
jgi:hypothetical protein